MVVWYSNGGLITSLLFRCLSRAAFQICLFLECSLFRSPLYNGLVWDWDHDHDLKTRLVWVHYLNSNLNPMSSNAIPTMHFISGGFCNLVSCLFKDLLHTTLKMFSNLWCLNFLYFRMLVIIVSLGFGIVKPRLGPTLHRVVGIGGLYFVIASTEAWLRVVKPKNDLSSTTLFAGIPLAVIDR